MISSPDDIKQLGTILGIWAHPDDETFSTGGLMAQAVKNGQKVICVTATKGEGGVYNEAKWPAEKISKIREKESQEALAILGIKDHHWLGFIDGQCREEDEAGIQKVLEFIEKYQPDTIISFGPDGMTGHTDHRAVSAWTSAAAAQSSKKPLVLQVVQTRSQYQKYSKKMDEKLNIYFDIDQPVLVEDGDCDVLFELTDDLQKLKVQALSAQASQTEKMLQEFDEPFLKKAFSIEAFKSAVL